MEQATNTFNKGLLTDTNPMILGNDTLTDCLNGTLITMNGNEVILLNDMGNRRVDNAYLPSGYEPVGIKEYGGIIYIAAYNPITNKSLIGSFPSPLLRYGNSSGLKATMSDSLFTEVFTDDLFPGINFLKNFIVLTPFVDSNSKKIILHTGDKFTVYGTLTPSEITNYNNVTGNKLNSPKNKKYTLSLGILNSLNEFVDFTKSLLRWNNNLIVTFDDNTPDYIKFNTGYFIPSSYSSPSNLNYTILDLDFIKNRLTISANTYAYKLVGPLYIKKELNIINNLTYNVYGNFYKDNETKKTEIFIETIYEYNCPDEDEDVSIIRTSNNKYASLQEISENSSFTTLYSTIKVDDNIISEENKKLVENTKYNEETNLYRAIKIAKTNLNKTEGIIKVMIVPQTSNNLGIRNLSYIESFDLSKLNSNEIELTDFRFYTNLEELTISLTVGFKAYPKYRNSFNDLKISIYNYDYYGQSDKEPIKIFKWGESGYNGIKTFIWDWDVLYKSHFFPVKISYSINSNNPFDSNNTQSSGSIKRWIMTTKLLNDCYYSSSSKFVKDYGKYDNDSKFNNIIEELLIVKPIFNKISVKDDETCDIYLNGDYIPFKSTNSNFNSQVLTLYNESILVKGNFDLDRDLYPLEVKLTKDSMTDESNELLLLGVSFQNNNKSLFPLNCSINGETYTVKNNDSDITYDKQGYGVTLPTYTFTYDTSLIGRESYIAPVKLKPVIINKLFTSFYEYFKDNYLPYATIALNSWDNVNSSLGGSDDSHALYFSTQLENSQGICDFPNSLDNAAPYRTCKIINHTGAEIYANHEYTFYFPTEKDSINSGIDSILGDKFIFVGTNNCHMKSYDKVYSDLLYSDSNSEKCPPRPIMFWMKSLDGWAILPVLEWPTDNITTSYILYGWIGPGGINNVDTNENVKTYIEKRIKDFYYIGKHNVLKNNLYTINSNSDPEIISYNNETTITLQINCLVRVSDIVQELSIKNVMPDERVFNNNGSNVKYLFNKPLNKIKVTVFTKNIIFNKTLKFEELIEYINEKLNTNTIDVALEEITYTIDNDTLIPHNTIYFTDYLGSLFNPNVLYVKDNGKFHPLDISVTYNGTTPLIESEHENCGIEWMYATEGNKYFGDDNDETYFYLGGVPTISKKLLK